MARPINRQCLHCASLSVDEVIALYGVEGTADTNCWNPNDLRELGYDCHKRRSYYLHRAKINRDRQLQRQRQLSESLPVAASTPNSIQLSPPTSPAPNAYAAILVEYRHGNARDALLHAIGVEIWQGDRIVGEIATRHCMEMNGPQVERYIRSLVERLQQEFQIQRFYYRKQLPVADCPLSPCPCRSRGYRKQRPAQAESGDQS